MAPRIRGDAVGTASKTSNAQARTMRAVNSRRDGTDGTRPTLKGSKTGAVSGKSPSTVGRSGTAASAKRQGTAVSKPSKGQDAAPRLGRSVVVSSSVTNGKYGTAKAKNTARSNTDHGSAVSGLDSSFGTAPARNRSTEPYGTAPAKGPHHPKG